MILMNDMAIFRLSSGTQLCLIKYIQVHIAEIIIKSITGSRAIKNSLKKVLEGNGPVTSMSVKKQSNDKNVSDDEPTLPAG